MNEKTLNVLDYPRILEFLGQYAVTEIGKKLCNIAQPSTMYNNVDELHNETLEARELLKYLSDKIIFGIKDLTTPIDRAKVEGVHLQASELIEIANLAFATRKLKESFEKTNIEFPIFSSYIAKLVKTIDLEDAIFPKFDEDQKLKDSASKTLHSIRRKIAHTETSIKKKLQEFLEKKELQPALQEVYITFRNGKFVIPVKASARSMVPGIVVDRSATGQTFFIEPLTIVELDNELTHLLLDEKEEEIKILKELTRIVAYNSRNLKVNLSIIGSIDLAFAKAKLSKRWNGNRPKLCKDLKIVIKDGYHPILIEQFNKGKIETVIPIDMELLDEKVLVITGPNTGGKTVALKTIGILCLMNQIGVFPPLSEDSELPVFSSIFADIGDEQSIEQNLSTFSSHIRNITNILKSANDGALVLLDEIGAGTDPDEGSSLSVAILEELANHEIKVIVTTHHSMIKTYAHSRDDFKNAAAQFDEITLKPTYKLIMGIPGRSNAFEIGRQLGLDESIIQRAKNLEGTDTAHINDLIKKLEIDSNEIDKLKKELEIIKSNNENLRKRLEDKESYIKFDSYLEAQGILIQAKNILSKSEGILHKQNVKQEDITILKMAVEQEMEKISKVEEKRIQKRLSEIEEIQIGDSIFIKSLKKPGKVLSIDKKNRRIKVQLGAMAVDVDLKDEIIYSSPIEKVNATEPQKIKIDAQIEIADTFSPEINIVGFRTDEFQELIEKFIDDAILLNMSSIRIIHGVGSGRLKKSVHEFLKGYPNISSFKLDTDVPGGDGVTIVKLR
jgi:DNA mismatch repair protein MutS2